MDAVNQATGFAVSSPTPCACRLAHDGTPHNSQVGGAAQSRQMDGDAADLNNQSGLLSERQAMIAAAGQGAGEAQADFEEPQDGPCGIACAHADWRSHAGGYSH